MLFVLRIEMTSGARKAGRITFADCVDMHRVQPLRQPFDVYSYDHSILRRTKGSGANTFSLGVLDISARLVLRAGVRRVDQQK
jgi:hypothetical protein